MTATISTTVTPRLRGVSHQLAFFVALGAGVALVATAATGRRAAAAAVYAISLALMFGVSATYHRRARSPAARAFWRRADHAAIAVCIAGTYTPICLIAVRGSAGAWLAALVWAGAALAVLRATLWVRAPRGVAAAIYVALGWAGIAYLPEVRAALAPAPLALVGLGGVFYTTGALIYALRRPDPVPDVFGYHEVFHALVIAGAAAHFAAIALVVAGAA